MVQDRWLWKTSVQLITNIPLLMSGSYCKALLKNPIRNNLQMNTQQCYLIHRRCEQFASISFRVFDEFSGINRIKTQQFQAIAQLSAPICRSVLVNSNSLAMKCRPFYERIQKVKPLTIERNVFVAFQHLLGNVSVPMTKVIHFENFTNIAFDVIFATFFSNLDHRDK